MNWKQAINLSVHERSKRMIYPRRTCKWLRQMQVLLWSFIDHTSKLATLLVWWGTSMINLAKTVLLAEDPHFLYESIHHCWFGNWKRCRHTSVPSNLRTGIPPHSPISITSSPLRASMRQYCIQEERDQTHMGSLLKLSASNSVQHKAQPSLRALMQRQYLKSNQIKTNAFWKLP